MSDESTPAADKTPSSGSQGKGRPTPKRQRSRGPVAPPPTTRREAAKRVRENNATKRGAVRGGMKAGEEAYLLPRDAGPVRKLVRDLVDSRRTTGTLLLPAAVLPLLGSFTGNEQVASFATTLWLFALMLAAADFFGANLRFRKAIRARFPDEEKVGRHVFYGLVRMLQFRRLRIPKPTVGIGDPVA